MLIVSGTISFDPANAARFWQLAGTLVEKTLEEPGCITYGFWADPSDPGRVRAYEEWKSTDAIAEHFGTPHMQEFMAGMGEVGITGIELHQHVVAESTKLM